MRDLPIIFGIFRIGGHLPPMLPPREYTAPGALRKIKFGIQVDFGFLYHIVLEFLKSEVICLRYILRVIKDLESLHLGFTQVLSFTFA